MNVLRWLVSGQPINTTQLNTGLTLLRVFTGITLAFQHGFMKFPPPGKFVQIVELMGFPFAPLFAWLAVLSEAIGGLLLAIGLFTRPASVFIMITMLVAAFIRNAGNPFSSMELALLYAFIAVLFLFTGSGRVGVDYFIRSKLRPNQDV